VIPNTHHVVTQRFRFVRGISEERVQSIPRIEDSKGLSLRIDNRDVATKDIDYRDCTRHADTDDPSVTVSVTTSL
jgi:hypothetical protein